MEKVYIVTGPENFPLRVFSEQGTAEKWLKANIKNRRDREGLYDISEWTVDDEE